MVAAFNNDYFHWGIIMTFPLLPLTLSTMYVTWPLHSLWPVAYADYESGGYSPKLLKPSDIEEVLCHTHFANLTGVWLGRSWLVFTCCGFPGADL